MIKLYKKDHKENMTWTWICNNSDQIEQQNKVLQKTDLQKFPMLMEFKHEFDLDAISKSISEAKELYGDYGWMSSEDPNGDEKPYSGFGLTWNPNHIENIPEHQSVLGSPDRIKFSYDQYSLNDQTTKSNPNIKLKDDYSDTYGFNVRTRASKNGALGDLLNNNVKRTLIKSRVSTMSGNRIMRQDWPYHRDGSFFIGTRVNIPVDTAKPYVFDLKTLPEPVHLKKGYAYAWDTTVLHRVVSMRPCKTDRTHIVINVSPWWDWNEQEQCWQTNEFYGEMHPLEMILDGHILEGLKGNYGNTVL